MVSRRKLVKMVLIFRRTKQRLNIARALQQEGDVFLLDDALSAVDPNTEDKLVESLMFGEWRDKACILTTHRLRDMWNVLIGLSFLIRVESLRKGPTKSF